MITKPLLSAKSPVLDAITFPVISSPKYDGIRCLMIAGKAVTRTLKPIPNDYIRTHLEANCPDGFDGEIILETGSFNDVQSAVMTKEGQPPFKYMVFDFVATSLDREYMLRLTDLESIMQCNTSPFINPVPMDFIEGRGSLDFIIKHHQELGYEGTMLRSPSAPYKCGRSTLNEGYLVAVKPFEDGEAEVIGFVEQYKNNNVATVDALGHTERSSHKENKAPKNTLGAFVVCAADGTIFEIGTGKGLTKKLRQEIWDNKEKYLGKIVHYRYQKHGTKDAPRIPSWYGFRHTSDVGE